MRHSGAIPRLCSGWCRVSLRDGRPAGEIHLVSDDEERAPNVAPNVLSAARSRLCADGRVTTRAQQAVGRPIVYDLTHLLHRAAYQAPSGIDRVDLLFARHYSHGAGVLAAAAHYGRKHVKTVSRTRLKQVTALAETRWSDSIALERDLKFARTVAWLMGQPLPKAGSQASFGTALRWRFATKILPSFRTMHRAVADAAIVPERAIYLNVAQHSFENPAFFAWLRRRPDVRAVFFLHDLLPLDYPEFWWKGHEALFRRRVDTALEHASAVITSSSSVRARIQQELTRCGKGHVPVFAATLPSPLEEEEAQAGALNPDLAAIPYFVVLGTIEPRKNHLLLFNIWRRFAAHGRTPPKLVVIGARGWENLHAVGMLERCPSLADHVWEVSGLSAPAIRSLLSSSRGLLMPSFAEGFGLPLVEALGLGAPVLASDLPVFREVTQDKALFRDPVDGLGWSAVIEALADPASTLSQEARGLARAFKPLRVESYFDQIDAFLASL